MLSTKRFKLLISIILCTSSLLIAQGETCSTAQLITINNTYFSNGPADGEGCYNCTFGAINADWYHFVAPAEGYAIVSSCEDPEGTDTRFWVYTGNCGQLTAYAGNDDANCGIGTIFSSKVEFYVEENTEYFIEWDDRWSQNAFNFELLFTLCPTITNLSVLNITNSSAMVSWNSAQGDPAFVEYGLTGYSPGTGTTVDGLNGTATLTGLNNGETYDVYVIENCGVGFSNGLGPVTFTTNLFPPPVNDDCEDAVSLICGQVIAGSTELATISQVGTTCGTAITAPGIWYTVVGNGSQMIASTCNMADYNTKISVYSGTCNILNCIGGIDDTGGCANNTSVFSWISQPGLTYFILIHGFLDQVGIFELELSCITCPAPTTLGVQNLMYNSADANWTSLNPGSGFIVEWGEAGFTQGTGTIESGTVGVDGPPVNLSVLEPQTQYEFYVTEICSVNDSSFVSGPHLFTTPGLPPMNDLCGSAVEVFCGDTVQGSTIDATIDSPLAPDCGSVTVVTHGIWYMIEGTGEQITASTCGMTTYDSKISVYEGSCDDLQCVVANDDAVGPGGLNCPGLSSIASFPSVMGVSYFILVHGYGTASTGEFSLAISCEQACAPVPTNNLCESAIYFPLSQLNNCLYISGNNECATANLYNPGCDLFGVIQDVWYTFNTGANTSIDISLNYVTAGNGSLALYQNCDSLIPIFCQNDIVGDFTIQDLDSNTAYLAQFWNGGANEAGSFELCMSAAFAAPPVSLTELNEAQEWSVYPIPASDKLHFQFERLNDIPHIEIYDLRGKKMFSHTIGADELLNFNLDINSWEKGMYLVKIQVQSGLSIKKILKQ